MTYRYYQGSETRREMVEFDITKNGRYLTTCAVDVDLLLCGITVFPCGNGDDVLLSAQQQLGILRVVRAERKRITDSYPVKTYRGWRESGLPVFEDYCFPGDKVDEEMVEHFINSVPPVLMRASCTQAGEPYSSEKDERGIYRSTYLTFHCLGGCRWRFDGYCFEGETKNRVLCKSKIERLIDEAQRNEKADVQVLL